MVYGSLTAFPAGWPPRPGPVRGAFNGAASAFSRGRSALRRHAPRAVRHDEAHRSGSRERYGRASADRLALLRLRSLKCAAPRLPEFPADFARDRAWRTDAALTTFLDTLAVRGRRPIAPRPILTA